jgi:LemA protein
MELLYILIGFIVLACVVLGIYLIATYNALTTLHVRVQEAWSDVTIQLKRRADLIPNLINTVKGYASHEKQVFTNVTQARAASINGSASPREIASAENKLNSALKSLFAIAEDYPQLQANVNFLNLQEELVDTEDKIQASRRFYNGGVREFNTKINVFPNNIFARRLGFTEREFFDVEDSHVIHNPPTIQF